MSARFRLAVLRHDLDRKVVDPLRYHLLSLVPRSVVYWVLIRAGRLDRGIRPDEVTPEVPFVTVLQRWGKAADRG